VKHKRYERGDAVWLHNPARKKGISPKLTRAWEGPFLVVNRLSEVTYRIQRGPKTKMKVVHFDRLKPYKGEEKPTWLENKMDKEQENNIIEEDNDKTILYEYNEEIGVEKANDGNNQKSQSINNDARRSGRNRNKPVRLGIDD
jgi:hypothetical protein